MRSLRTRFTMMTVFAVIFSVVVVSLLSVVFIRVNQQKKSDQLLLLLCETGEKNLDYYFNSVQKSVEKVASFVEADLDGIDDESLDRHMGRVSDYFDEMASKTNGVLTYYYRVDPDVSENVKGFWFIDLDGEGFVEHEVTDITQYDTSDTSKLVWFTVPKYEGKSIWLPPYITDNLEIRVISYNVPIFWRGKFIGVVGIEIDYSTMAEQVNSIRLYNMGYAFLSSSDGTLFYHPRIDVTQLTDETMPAPPDGILSESTFFRYKFDGVEKVGAWLPLSNGMRLNVTVPVSEAEGDWRALVVQILLVALAVLTISVLFTLMNSKRITKPIKDLTQAADMVDNGNYELKLEYDKDDEIGRLTKTFKQLAGHMREYINDLNKQVFIDALTHVKNKGAFASAVNDLQRQIDAGIDYISFAIGIFDCDELKIINDRFGHDKGDVYIKTASNTICNIFHHSPVFRIGGDEFAVIIRNEDLRNIEPLVKQFELAVDKINSSNANRWEQVQISMGIATYEPESDNAVTDVVRRADKIMYENKNERKNARASSEADKNEREKSV